MYNLVLYRALAGPPARSVMMLSDLLQLKLQYRDINILQRQHMSPAFKKLNPMCTVPVLRDGEFVVSESHAIMKYLLSMYGGDKSESLYPSDARTRALVDQSLFFNATIFFMALSKVSNSTLKNGLVGPTDEHIEEIEAAYAMLDAYLEERPYLATDHLTIADLAAGSTATAMQVIHKLDCNKYPRCSFWLSRLENEDVFKTINSPGVTYFARVMHKFWTFNKLQNET